MHYIFLQQVLLPVKPINVAKLLMGLCGLVDDPHVAKLLMGLCGLVDDPHIAKLLMGLCGLVDDPHIASRPCACALLAASLFHGTSSFVLQPPTIRCGLIYNPRCGIG